MKLTKYEVEELNKKCLNNNLTLNDLTILRVENTSTEFKLPDASVFENTFGLNIDKYKRKSKNFSRKPVEQSEVFSNYQITCLFIIKKQEKNGILLEDAHLEYFKKVKDKKSGYAEGIVWNDSVLKGKANLKEKFGLNIDKISRRSKLLDDYISTTKIIINQQNSGSLINEQYISYFEQVKDKMKYAKQILFNNDLQKSKASTKIINDQEFTSLIHLYENAKNKKYLDKLVLSFLEITFAEGKSKDKVDVSVSFVIHVANTQDIAKLYKFIISRIDSVKDNTKRKQILHSLYFSLNIIIQRDDKYFNEGIIFLEEKLNSKKDIPLVALTLSHIYLSQEKYNELKELLNRNLEISKNAKQPIEDLIYQSYSDKSGEETAKLLSKKSQYPKKHHLIRYDSIYDDEKYGVAHDFWEEEGIEIAKKYSDVNADKISINDVIQICDEWKKDKDSFSKDKYYEHKSGQKPKIKMMEEGLGSILGTIILNQYKGKRVLAYTNIGTIIKNDSHIPAILIEENKKVCYPQSLIADYLQDGKSNNLTDLESLIESSFIRSRGIMSYMS